MVNEAGEFPLLKHHIHCGHNACGMIRVSVVACGMWHVACGMWHVANAPAV